MPFKYNGKNYSRRTAVYNQLLGLGMPIQAIANRFDVTYAAVFLFKKAQEKNGKIYPRVPNQRTKAKIRRERMETLAKQGISRAMISKKLGVSYELVAERLKNSGIQIKDMRIKGNREKKRKIAA
jgi:transposase